MEDSTVSVPETMLVAKPSAGVLPGLEPLIPLDQIFVKQKVDLAEVWLNIEVANQYTFFANDGRALYLGQEESDCCAQQFCKNARGFKLFIRDPDGNGILLERPLVCCLTSMSVFSISTGELLGSIEQRCHCPIFTGAKFDILDATGNLVFIIKCPVCTAACFSNVVFDVVSPLDKQTTIGQITKTWAGIMKEALTQADNFGITFPVDLSVKLKAVLLGACILIDFMFYENTGNE